MLSLTHASEKEIIHQFVMKMAQNIRFIACQGLPLNGDGTEDNGNFNQLLLLRTLDDPNLPTWM